MVSTADKWQRLKQHVTEKGLYGANKANTTITLKLLEDLELGINVNRERGARSPGRLISIVRRMSTISYMVEQAYGKDKELTNLTEREVLELFRRIRSGEQKGKKGRPIKDVSTFAETVAQFWRWHIKVMHKEGITIPDIVLSLDTRNDYKPPWVLLTEEEIRKLIDHCNPEYKALVWFAIDSGARPQEIKKILVRDISTDSEGIMWCDLRLEIAKKGSFGRKFKLLVSNEIVKEYIKRNNLQPNNCLFPQRVEATKRYLRHKAIKLWGDAVSPARNAYKNISMYDLRHCAAVYWRQRYKSFNAYLYRMGWKNPMRAYYYDEFLGHKDSLQEEDLLIDTTVPKLEKELLAERQKRELLEEQISELNKRLELIELWGRFRTSPKEVHADAQNTPKQAKTLRISTR